MHFTASVILAYIAAVGIAVPAAVAPNGKPDIALSSLYAVLNV